MNASLFRGNYWRLPIVISTMKTTNNVTENPNLPQTTQKPLKQGLFSFLSCQVFRQRGAFCQLLHVGGEEF